jgi:S1-C subfamily serine protease
MKPAASMAMTGRTARPTRFRHRSLRTSVWRAARRVPTAPVVFLGAMTTLLLLGLNHQSEADAEAMLDVAVSVRTLSHVRIDRVGDSVWGSGSGAGFLVSSQTCEVWTNHHVIEDAALIEVFPHGWTQAVGIPAVVVDSSARADVAILRMQHCDGIPQARLGDSEGVRPGDEAYAVGNPLGHNPDSISRGIISHTERYVSASIPHLQTDAAINPGNSGGALFNRRGEVIGINTALASADGGNVGIGYAVPINVAKAVVERLRRGPPRWGDAGLDGRVTGLTPEEAKIFRVPDGNAAIVVTATPTSGPSAGKLFAHDAIFEIDGRPIRETAQAMGRIADHEPGDTVHFRLLRAGEIASTEITLVEARESGESRDAEQYEGYLGMTLEMWVDESAEQGRFENPVITKVQSLGPAHKARIASSQRNLRLRGPFAIAYQMDVKTVAGLVYDGRYHGVPDAETLDRYAALAYRETEPLLLEIQLWGRANPLDLDAPLERVGSAFHKIVPSLSAASEADTLAESATLDTSARDPREG